MPTPLMSQDTPAMHALAALLDARRLRSAYESGGPSPADVLVAAAVIARGEEAPPPALVAAAAADVDVVADAWARCDRDHALAVLSDALGEAACEHGWADGARGFAT